MAELTKVHARDIAEYLFLAGFSKKAVLELMSGPVKTMILKEGYTIPTSTENEWFNKDYEYSKWSQKFVHDMTFLGTPIDAAQTIGFRKMQPLIVKSGSKSKNPAGLKAAKFKGDIKKGMSDKILLIAAGEKFEEGYALDKLEELEEADKVPQDSPATKVALTVPGSVPKLSHTRKLKKRAFPENKKLPAGDGPILVTLKPNSKTKDMSVPRIYQKKTKWVEPTLTLIFEAGETVKYGLSNSQDLYEVIMDGKPIIFQGGYVKLTKFAASPKTVAGFEATLSQGSFNIDSTGGVTEFFSPSLIKVDGFPFTAGIVAPLIGFPIPDLTDTEVGGIGLKFSMEEFANDPSSRKNWFPPREYKDVADGTANNPPKWVAIYSEIEGIQWSPDGLTSHAEYLQPLPFNPRKAKKLDLKKEYISVLVEVEEATDIYTGYDWKSPNSRADTLIFPGDERNLIPLTRKGPDEKGKEVEIKGASRGNAIKEIRFHNGTAEITVDGGSSFLVPDASGDGTFYALDNTSVKIDGKRQELKSRVKAVTVENYESKATADTTWSNMRAVRRYKNLATSILPSATDAVGRDCPVCSQKNVVAPCEIEGCPMPTETEVGVASLGYYTTEASGTYLILLVPDETDPSTTFEIRLTVQQ
jgi:hypothetical protein